MSSILKRKSKQSDLYTIFMEKATKKALRGPSLPTQIDVTVTLSSNVLHKHNCGSPFTITLEATLPASPNGSNKPLTLFIHDTLLDPKGLVFMDNGLELINTETVERTHRPSFGPCDGFQRSAYWSVSRKYERHFITLRPGESYRVTHIMKVSPKFSLANKHDKVSWVSPYAHSQGLKLGATYRVNLGDDMSQIRWYRSGEKEKVLHGYGGFWEVLCGLTCLKGKSLECLGDAKMQPIPLVLQNEAVFTVAD